jgi:biopolymer transport protein ExbD
VNFQRGREREPLEINLVPLIDVMMVILIFLMITTTYSKYTELQINLPSADAQKQLERPNEVAVLVNAQGQYVINRNAVPFRSVEQLADELRRAGGALKEPIVVISADAAATHQSVVRVMEAARLAGLSQITYTTQSNKSCGTGTAAAPSPGCCGHAVSWSAPSRRCAGSSTGSVY